MNKMRARYFPREVLLLLTRLPEPPLVIVTTSHNEVAIVPPGGIKHMIFVTLECIRARERVHVPYFSRPVARGRRQCPSVRRE